MAGSAGDARGDVQDAAAERVDLTAGQLGLVGEPEQLCPCDQIGGGQDDFQPRGVRLGAVTGQVAQPGGLGLADAVLHPACCRWRSFELPVVVYLAWRAEPYTATEFRAPLLYRVVRHPLMLGFVIAFWAAPTMTAGHLLFALATTGYILIALQLEERDLTAVLGDHYRQYRHRVPMLIPGLHRPGRRRTVTETTTKPA